MIDFKNEVSAFDTLCVRKCDRKNRQAESPFNYLINPVAIIYRVTWFRTLAGGGDAFHIHRNSTLFFFLPGTSAQHPSQMWERFRIQQIYPVI
jgi:hypothetical protein